MSFLESSYGPVMGELLQTDRCRPLDEGQSDRAMRDTLSALSLEQAFGHKRILDPTMARCCLSGMWLLYDFLDDSHAISQGISTAEGSFWHGIMHRREGDFSNAKYWFRKVGDHPVYDLLTDELESVDRWDPFEFVDECQAALRTGTDAQRCREYQQLEWELLFDYCYSSAVGE